jgi:ArsR family transcriptional regulator, lead/cadmium/zinc/bismuth-responsive transcriptional repressor
MNRSTITRRASRSALLLADAHAAELADLFRLLGDPTRLRIVLTCLDAPTAVGEIADRLDLSASLVSHHLRLLRAARIVRSERHGKQVFYAAADDHVRCVVVDMLEHVAEPQSDED